ncbi:MAG TPA: alkane 1-monooxygenase [Rhizomicrobium sp.]|nr:alkane 1-monooxygenase [Rhizomicrobium sp.]
MLLYGGPFLLLASIPVFYYGLGPAGPLATIGLLLSALIGAEFVSPRGDVIRGASDPGRYRALFYVYVPLQLVSIGWATDQIAHTSALGIVSLVIAVGVTTGVFGMLAAHELVHSRSRGERMLGGIMLSGMVYRHFRIAHVHFHHRYAATERDSATARLGEGFYAFLIRTVIGQFRESWQFERARLNAKGVLANRAVLDVAVSIILCAAIFAVWHWQGLAFFLAQSLVAITVLELFNYIAHYGLMRSAAVNGRLEPLADHHSWNSSNMLVNLLIFNMGRHSYHHRKPSASYQELQYLRTAPELPAGYAGSILLALVPPLWRHVMDGRVLERRAGTIGEARLAA